MARLVCSFPNQEQQKQGKGDKFHHRWLFEETLTFSRETGSGGLFTLKGKGCTAFFVAYITSRTDSTRIPSLTVSPPFITSDQLSSTLRLTGIPEAKKTWAMQRQLGTLELIFLNWTKERAPLHSNTKRCLLAGT